MNVRFWGTRGSIAVPGFGTAKYGGNTSCVEVRTSDGTVIVLDCGTGARDLGMELMRSAPQPLRLHLFIGHTHWDHIQGFPFFVPAFLPNAELNIYAPLGFQHTVADAIAGQMQYPYFPITLRDLRSRIHFIELEEGFFRVGDALVETQYLNHTAPTIAYRISSNGATVAYVTDHEPFWKPDGKVFRHPGDQRHIAFLKGADLVIHDAQYTDEEYATKVGWGHSTFEYATDVALAAGSARLALFHHDPAHDDTTLDRLEGAARARVMDRRGTLDVFAAQEGLSLELLGTGTPHASPTVTALRRRSIAGGRVLVVSANETEVAAIGKMLAEDELVLLSATDKRAALEQVLDVSPDLAIIDSRLPDGDGAELIRPLRSRLGREDLPVLLLTDGVEAERAVLNGELEATDYLAQPCNIPMLHTRIRSWLDRTFTLEGAGGRPMRPRTVPVSDAHDAPKRAAIENTAAVLGSILLFRSLTKEQLLKLAEVTTEQDFLGGHVIIRQGEFGESLYVVQSGRVRVVEAASDSPLTEQVLGELGRGEIFGELGILVDQPRSATVVAIERTKCMVLPQKDFLQVLQDSSALAVSLLRVVAGRLYNADRMLARYAPDPLTGLAGRRAFHDQYRQMIGGAKRQGKQVALLLIDIVHLRAFNDRFGYAVGDEILRAGADALREHTRATDLVVRSSGDEFAALLVGAGVPEADLVANRIRDKFLALVSRRGLPPGIAIVIGAAFVHEPPETADELLWSADQDMRQKKIEP